MCFTRYVRVYVRTIKGHNLDFKMTRKRDGHFSTYIRTASGSQIRSIYDFIRARRYSAQQVAPAPMGFRFTGGLIDFVRKTPVYTSLTLILLLYELRKPKRFKTSRRRALFIPFENDAVGDNETARSKKSIFRGAQNKYDLLRILAKI